MDDTQFARLIGAIEEQTKVLEKIQRRINNINNFVNFLFIFYIIGIIIFVIIYATISSGSILNL